MKYEIMLRILFELLAKRKVSATYIADKYEISVRTVYRYIECLEYAGVPIYTTRGTGGGFSIVDTYRLSSTFMSVKEFEHVINALSAINDEVPNKLLSSAIIKLQAVSKKEYSGFDIKSGNLIIDGGPWGDAVGYKSKLAVMQKAIDENRSVLITYHDRNGQISERKIDPHIMVFKQGIWYVYAFCHLRQEFRFFKTGRIEIATVLEESFVRKEVKKEDMPLDFWNNAVEAKDVTLEINEKYLSDVEEWLGVENVCLENGKHVARVKLPYDKGLVSKIMSYGDGIKVLEPVELKEEILRQANELIAIY